MLRRGNAIVPSAGWALLLTLLAGCPDEDGAQRRVALKEGLAAARAEAAMPPLDSAALSAAEGFVDVLGRTPSSLRARLPALRWSLTLSLTLEAGGTRELVVDEVTELGVDRDGGFAVSRRTRGEARDDGVSAAGARCWWVDGAFYTAGAHGGATRVPVLADEDARCLDQALEPLSALLVRSANSLDLSVSGERSVAGRDAVVVAFLRAGRGVEIPPAVPTTRTEDPDDRSRAVWGPRPPLFETHLRLMEMSGQVALDRETGLPLTGRLDGAFALRKKGVDARLVVSARLEAAANPDAVVAPEATRVQKARARPFEDRRALLGEGERDADAGALPAPGTTAPLVPGEGEALETLPSDPEDLPPPPGGPR